MATRSGGDTPQETTQTVQRTASEIRSYVALRMSVGVVAVLLPVLTVGVVAFREHELLPSLSDSYYHRYALSVFVGAMFAFAAFLFSYEFSRWENRLGNLGALAAVLVAVFPTPPDTPPTLEETVGGVIHFTAAAAFFVILAVFCFVWSRDPAEGEPRRSYLVSSMLILLAVIAAAVIKVAGAGLAGQLALGPGAPRVGFLLAEVAVVEFFGFSWLLRGGIPIVRAWLATTVATAVTVAVAVVPVAVANALVPAVLAVVAVLAVPALLWGQRPGARGNRLTPRG